MTAKNTTPNQAWAEETNKFLRSPQWNLIRKLTFTHFEKKCTNCGSTDNIHLDHIVARVNDPTGKMWLNINNLQPLCEHCNTVIKGRKNTDYRSKEHITKCEELTPLFERALSNKGYSSSWSLWVNKKANKDVSPKIKRQLAWKGKIRRLCNKTNMTYDKAMSILKLNENHIDFKYVNNYLSFCLSDGQKQIKARKAKKINNAKTIKKKAVLLDNLNSKSRSLTRQELISAIDKIAKLQL